MSVESYPYSSNVTDNTDSVAGLGLSNRVSWPERGRVLQSKLFIMRFINKDKMFDVWNLQQLDFFSSFIATLKKNKQTFMALTPSLIRATCP